jgi:hypothetical protein
MVAFKGIFHDTRLEREEGVAFAADLERRMCLLCFLALSLDVEMTMEEISEKQRVALESKVQLFLNFFRRTLGVVVEYGSQTGLRRPKFHAALHVIRDVIPKYGSTTNTFGGYLESFLRILVKEPLKRTSRKHGTFQWELINRYSEEQVRRASKERLTALGFNVSENKDYDTNQSISASGSASSQMTNTTSKGRWFTPGGTVFSCIKNTDNGAWSTVDSRGFLLTRGGTGAFHPGYPDDVAAKKWVVEMTKAADFQSANNAGRKYDRIDFTYHLKTPNSMDDAHDIFRCHPNFHGSHSKPNPWHDWAMLRYEEDVGDVTEQYDVAGKLCLWGVFRNSEYITSSTNLDVYGVFHPMKEYKPQKDETMPFLRKDVLANNVEVLPFDAVVSTAYVLPINWSRTQSFPNTEQSAKAFCIIPPRSQWPEIGWDQNYLKNRAMKDTRNLPFI